MTFWDQLEMLAHFAMLSAIAVGGAVSMVPDISRYMVDEKALLTAAQFSEAIARAQCPLCHAFGLADRRAAGSRARDPGIARAVQPDHLSCQPLAQWQPRYARGSRHPAGPVAAGSGAHLIGGLGDRRRCGHSLGARSPLRSHRAGVSGVEVEPALADWAGRSAGAMGSALMKCLDE